MLVVLGVPNTIPVKAEGAPGAGSASPPAQAEARGRQIAPGVLIVQESPPTGGYLTPNKSGESRFPLHTLFTLMHINDGR